MSKNKRKAASKTPECVYVLTQESWDHGDPRRTGHEVIGIYATKEAATANLGDIQTAWGSVDEAIEDMFSDEWEHEDHRGSPPDDGLVLGIGGDDVGEGDYVRFYIKKMPVLEGAASTKKKAAKKQTNKKGATKRKVDSSDEEEYGYGLAY